MILIFFVKKKKELTAENTILLFVMQKNTSNNISFNEEHSKNFLAIGIIDNDGLNSFVGNIHLPLYPKNFFEKCSKCDTKPTSFSSSGSFCDKHKP